MAESDDCIVQKFVQEFGGNEHEMNPASGITFLNRNVNRDVSIADQCTGLENLFQGSRVVKREDFEWVACGGLSDELYLCEKFLDAGVGNDAPSHWSMDLIDI